MKVAKYGILINVHPFFYNGKFISDKFGAFEPAPVYNEWMSGPNVSIDKQAISLPSHRLFEKKL